MRSSTWRQRRLLPPTPHPTPPRLSSSIPFTYPPSTPAPSNPPYNAYSFFLLQRIKQNTYCMVQKAQPVDRRLVILLFPHILLKKAQEFQFVGQSQDSNYVHLPAHKMYQYGIRCSPPAPFKPSRLKAGLIPCPFLTLVRPRTSPASPRAFRNARKETVERLRDASHSAMAAWLEQP